MFPQSKFHLILCVVEIFLMKLQSRVLNLQILDYTAP